MDSMKSLKDVILLYKKEEKRDYSNYNIKVWDNENKQYRDIVIYPDGNPDGYGAIIRKVKDLAVATDNIRKDFSKYNYAIYAIDRSGCE